MYTAQFLGGDGDAADMYAGMGGFVVEEPLAALSDDELLAHVTILPTNLGGGEGGGGLSSGTPETFAAFGKDVLKVGVVGNPVVVWWARWLWWFGSWLTSHIQRDHTHTCHTPTHRPSAPCTCSSTSRP
jgi:hypothetical protein